MIDPAGRQTKARVALESWSTPGPLGPDLESHRTAGRNRGPSDMGASRPRPLVKPAVHGPGLELPGISGQPGGPSGRGPSRPGWLVYTAGPPTRARVAWDTWSTPRTLGPMARVTRHSWSTLRAIGTERNSPRTACRHREPTDTSASHAGHQVDTAGPQAGPETPSVSWSTLRALGQGPSPGTAGRHRTP